SSPAPAPGPPPASTQEALTAKVRCNFSSTPPGAEITVDWRYVGSTPSEISLRPGTHIVVISMQGFDEWKRELTVAADSAVNVTANLQKTQP
ncbi:MAG: PEGA domain-containing protein, partial [Terriglobales bacterium]